MNTLKLIGPLVGKLPGILLYLFALLGAYPAVVSTDIVTRTANSEAGTRRAVLAENQAFYNAGIAVKCLTPAYITSVGRSGNSSDQSWLARGD